MGYAALARAIWQMPWYVKYPIYGAVEAILAVDALARKLRR